MADINKLVPTILKWEGGYVNDPSDLGGATNKGITIGTYSLYRRRNGYRVTTISDLKNISDAEWLDVLKTLYWDKWLADNINSQPVANILVDWVWASGSYGIKLPQKILRVKTDGVVGPRTLTAVNTYPDQKELFRKIKQERFDFIERIIHSRPANRKFRKGWINRINDFKFTE